MVEKLDVYDRKKKRTGKVIERKEGEILNKGEYIISVQCWIINNQGKILLTKRNLNKTYGGMWEPTNGLVISGEASKEAIKRELKEEIGLDIEENKITLIKEIVEENENMNFFRDIYLIKEDISLNKLSFNDGEVIDAKYVTVDEFSRMIENNEAFEWLRYFLGIMKGKN